MRIALAISGHIRYFQKDNMISHIILPLIERGHSVDIFVNGWMEEGMRDSHTWNVSINYDEIKKVMSVKPVVLNLEHGNRSGFISRFRTQHIHQLSSEETYGDAMSMWYKVCKVMQDIKDYEEMMSINYDVIIRHRPDIILTSLIPIDMVERCVINDILCMPKWHGRYREVTYTMMDQFFFGNKRVMEKVCNIYKLHDLLLSSRSEYKSAEGMLYGIIQVYDIPVERIDIHYSIKRTDKLELVI
jgi:hypothetical protein